MHDFVTRRSAEGIRLGVVVRLIGADDRCDHEQEDPDRGRNQDDSRALLVKIDGRVASDLAGSELVPPAPLEDHAEDEERDSEDENRRGDDPCQDPHVGVRRMRRGVEIDEKPEVGEADDRDADADFTDEVSRQPRGLHRFICHASPHLRRPRTASRDRGHVLLRSARLTSSRRTTTSSSGRCRDRRSPDRNATR